MGEACLEEFPYLLRDLTALFSAARENSAQPFHVVSLLPDTAVSLWHAT